MSKFDQNAPRTIRTAKQIVDSLVNGQRELRNFPEICTDSLAYCVLDELISRIRPLTLEVRQLECKLDRFVEKYNKGF